MEVNLNICTHLSHRVSLAVSFGPEVEHLVKPVSVWLSAWLIRLSISVLWHVFSEMSFLIHYLLDSLKLTPSCPQHLKAEEWGQGWGGEEEEVEEASLQLWVNEEWQWCDGGRGEGAGVEWRGCRGLCFTVSRSTTWLDCLWGDRVMCLGLTMNHFHKVCVFWVFYYRWHKASHSCWEAQKYNAR